MNKGVSFRRRLLKTTASEKEIRAICFSTLNPNEQQTVRCDFASTISNINLQYSTNGVDFQTYNNGQEITFGGENKVWFRGKNDKLSTNLTDNTYTNFKLLDTSVLTRCDGNIIDLLNYEEKLTSLDANNDYAFSKLFQNCTALYSCPDILIEKVNSNACFNISCFRASHYCDILSGAVVRHLRLTSVRPSPSTYFIFLGINLL